MMEQKEALRREIFRLAVPIAFGQFMTALVGASDAVMLGDCGEGVYIEAPFYSNFGEHDREYYYKDRRITLTSPS